jgi:hypothetical protein
MPAPTVSGSGSAGGNVDLTWNDSTPAGGPLGNPANEIGFRIERATVSPAGVASTYTVVGAALANKTSYRDTTSAANQTYRYRVVAFNAAGERPSNAITVNDGGFFTRYEDTNGNLSYTGSWTSQSSTALSGGSYRYTNNASGTVTAAFTGTGIDWITVMQKSSGIASVSVDGGAWIPVDLYSATYAPASKAWGVSGLPDRLHTVRIQWSGSKNASGTGTFVGADAFDVRGTLVNAKPSRVQQTDSKLKYTGVWSTGTGTFHSGGSYKYSGTATGTVMAAFVGTGLDWITVKQAGNGIARVSVDGGAWVDVDLYSAAFQPAIKVWGVSGLPWGNHTVVIEWTGRKASAATNTRIGVDAFDVGGLLMAVP